MTTEFDKRQNPTRRDFLKTSAFLGGALFSGCLSGCQSMGHNKKSALSDARIQEPKQCEVVLTRDLVSGKILRYVYGNEEAVNNKCKEDGALKGSEIGAIVGTKVGETSFGEVGKGVGELNGRNTGKEQGKEGGEFTAWCVNAGIDIISNPSNVFDKKLNSNSVIDILTYQIGLTLDNARNDANPSTNKDSMIDVGQKVFNMLVEFKNNTEESRCDRTKRYQIASYLIKYVDFKNRYGVEKTCREHKCEDLLSSHPEWTAPNAELLKLSNFYDKLYQTDEKTLGDMYQQNPEQFKTWLS